MREAAIVPDQWLVARAQLKADGGTVHKLNNILTAYLGYCSLGIKEDAIRYEAILRRFLVSGKFIQ